MRRSGNKLLRALQPDHQGKTVTEQQAAALTGEVRAHLEKARECLTESSRGSVECALAPLESAADTLQRLVEEGRRSKLGIAEVDALAAQLKGLTILAAHGAGFWRRLGERSGIPEGGEVRSWKG
jgi:hypothetical protein